MAALLCLCCLATSCQGRERPVLLPILHMVLAGNQSTFTLSSTSFQDGDLLDSRYTLGGHNISPQLSWSNAPSGTKSYRIKVYDLDAQDGNGNFRVHWLVEVPVPVSSLAENAGAAGGANLPAGSIRYHNSFYGQNNPAAAGTDYDGPDPPVGSLHRYIFTVTPLDGNGNPLGPGAQLEARYLKAILPPPAP